jgi:multiple sugar transport system ATP-binding protein
VPANAVSFGIRPEHIELTDAGSGQIQGSVDVLEYLGADTFVIMSCGEAGQITVRVNGSATCKPGDKAGLAFSKADTHAFDQDGLAIG